MTSGFIANITIICFSFSIAYIHMRYRDISWATHTHVETALSAGFAIIQDENMIFEVKVNDVENCRFFFISFVFIYRYILIACTAHARRNAPSKTQWKGERAKEQEGSTWQTVYKSMRGDASCNRHLFSSVNQIPLWWLMYRTNTHSLWNQYGGLASRTKKNNNERTKDRAKKIENRIM